MSWDEADSYATMDRRDIVASLDAAKTVPEDNFEYLKMEDAEVLEPIRTTSDMTREGCERLHGAEYVSSVPVDGEDGGTRSKFFKWARQPRRIQLVATSAPTTATDDAACSAAGLNCATRVSKPHSANEANIVSKAHRIHLNMESQKKTTVFEKYPKSPSEDREETFGAASALSNSGSSIEVETVSKTRRISLELTSLSKKDAVEYAMMDHDYGHNDRDDGDDDDRDDDEDDDGYHDWNFTRLFLFHLGVTLFPFVMGTTVRCVATGMI